MNIIGFDPGYSRLGVAVVKKQQNKHVCLFSDCLTTPSTLNIEKRYKHLGVQIVSLLDQWKPEVAVFETIYFTKNKKTVFAVAQLKGILMYLAAERGIEHIELGPREVKALISGSGAAEKAQIARIVDATFCLEKSVAYDDEYDAIAVALAGALTINTLSTRFIRG